jgi:hypothetical protein
MRKLVYVIMISKVFPSYHTRKGEPTNFKELIESGVKIHTIRQNYELWKKREAKVNAGLAIVSLREWEGKPRRSNHVEIMQLEKISVQSIEPRGMGIEIEGQRIENLTWRLISKNDGLGVNDFYYWFTEALNKLNAVIHFTDFRY